MLRKCLFEWNSSNDAHFPAHADMTVSLGGYYRVSPNRVQLVARCESSPIPCIVMHGFPDPRMADDMCVHHTGREDPIPFSKCSVVFVQGLQNPAFAHLNGALCLQHELSPRDNGPDRVEVLVFNSEDATAYSKVCLKPENLRLVHPEEPRIPGERTMKSITAWVAEALNDVSLCQHRRIARLRFVIISGIVDFLGFELGKLIARTVVDLIRTETAPDFDLSKSCTLEALGAMRGENSVQYFHNPLAVDDPDHPESIPDLMHMLLGVGVIDAYILFVHKVSKHMALYAAEDATYDTFISRLRLFCWERVEGTGELVDNPVQLGTRCDAEECGETLRRFGGLKMTIWQFFSCFLEALPQETPVHFHHIDGKEFGVNEFSRDFHTFCTGFDGHKVLRSPGVSSALHQIFHRSNWNWCEDPPRIDPVGLGQILWILPTTPADPERIPAAKKMDVNPVTVLISQLRSIIETIDVLMSKHAYAALTTSTPYRVDRHAHLHPHLKNYSNNYEDGEYNMGGFYSNQILTEADAEHQEYIKTMQRDAHAHMDIFHRMFSRISRTPIPR